MFELVERITIAGDRATGTAAIPAGHPMLADHFPERPLVPGTWLVEIAAQVAGKLAEAHAPDRWAILAMIDRAKITAPVEPPAHLAIDAAIARLDVSAINVRATVSCRDAVVLTATLVFAMIEKS